VGIGVGLAVLAVGASSDPASPKTRDSRYLRDTPVPILMYHVIGEPPAGAPYPELYVRPSDFDGQVRRLARRGYTAVTLRAVWDHWRGKGELPPRPVVFTFDDGYRSIVTRAMPVLRARGWPGVLNLAVRNISERWGFGESRIRGLVRLGWEIDSHTLTHPDLTALDSASLRREVAGSRAAIRSRFRVPVDFFCYPSGRFDTRVVAAVMAAGYLGATTTAYGLARPDKPYRLARVRVSRSDGIDGFVAKLTALEKS